MVGLLQFVDSWGRPSAARRRDVTYAGEIDNLEAWLVSVVGRVALNMLRSRRTRREEPLDARLPDPNVARRALAASQPGLVARPALVNGAAGWVALLDGDAYAIAALTLQDGRTTTMHILLDPARLARLDLAAFDPHDEGWSGSGGR